MENTKIVKVNCSECSGSGVTMEYYRYVHNPGRRGPCSWCRGSGKKTIILKESSLPR